MGTAEFIKGDVVTVEAIVDYTNEGRVGLRIDYATVLIDADRVQLVRQHIAVGDAVNPYGVPERRGVVKFIDGPEAFVREDGGGSTVWQVPGLRRAAASVDLASAA